MGAKMEPNCNPKWVPSPLRESKCQLSAKPIIYYVLATFWWCPKPPKIGFCRPNSRSSCSAHLLATRESSKSVWGPSSRHKCKKGRKWSPKRAPTLGPFLDILPLFAVPGALGGQNGSQGSPQEPPGPLQASIFYDFETIFD